jgi:hypothetical protein
MKYTFTIVSHTPSTFGKEREKMVLESRAGESDRHIALKILAYVLFAREVLPLALRIEQSVGQRHKPDLVATDEETGAVVFCGQIETKRLGRIVAQNPKAQIVVVKPTANEARLYAQAALRFLPDEVKRLQAVRFGGFDEDFLPAFLSVMRGTNEMAWSDFSGDTSSARLKFTLNGAPLSTFWTLFNGANIPV